MSVYTETNTISAKRSSIAVQQEGC